jgi:hypothetical protein
MVPVVLFRTSGLSHIPVLIFKEKGVIPTKPGD